MASQNKTASFAFAAPLGAGLVILSSVFYASYGIWTKLMGDFFGGYTASALRSLLGFLVLVVLALVLKRLGPLKLRENWKWLVGLLVTAALVWGPLYYAILHAGLGVTLTIAYASIVLGMFLFGWLLSGERMNNIKWLSAALGIVGLGLVFSPSLQGIGWLTLAGAVVSGLSTAAHYIMVQKLQYNTAQGAVVMWGASTIASGIMAIMLSEPVPATGFHIEWLYLAAFTLASLAATTSLIRGMRFIDAGVAGILGLLEIVFGIVFGVVLFGERPGQVALFGAALIIGAAAMPYIIELKKTNSKQRANSAA